MAGFFSFDRFEYEIWDRKITSDLPLAIIQLNIHSKPNSCYWICVGLGAKLSRPGETAGVIYAVQIVKKIPICRDIRDDSENMFR